MKYENRLLRRRQPQGSPAMQSALGYVYVALAALMWAFIGPLAQICFNEGTTPMEVAFWRCLTGALFFMAHAAVTGRWRAGLRDAPVFTAFGLVGIALFFGSYQISVREGGAALASIMLYTAPAWVALLARICFAEALTPHRLAALALAMSGTMLVSLSGGAGSGSVTAGVLWGLVAGFSYSLHYVFGKTYLHRYSSVTLYSYCLPAGALALLPWVTFSQHSALGWFALIMEGFLCTWLAYLAYCAGLKRLAASRAAIVANLEPVAAAVLAYWWWNEILPPVGLAGSALVLSGVFVVVREKNTAATA